MAAKWPIIVLGLRMGINVIIDSSLNKLSAR